MLLRLRRNNPVSAVFAVLVAASMVPLCFRAQAQDSLEATGEAAPNQAIVGSALGGRYFAPKPLKESYDRLVSKVRSLEIEIREGRISGELATREVKLLQKELTKVREQIEREKSFVPAGKIHTKSDSMTFELGAGRTILILATKVRIVGWDRPEVKCVLDKTVLTPGDEPVEKHIEQIQIVHEHRLAPELVGKTPEELDAEETKYLASPEGQKLDPKQRDWRRRFLYERIGGQLIYYPLQGQPIDVLTLKGFSHQEGNRQITLKVQSPNGEGSHSSVWQRHADLTLYVPACNAIAVKGGLRGIDVTGVESALILRGDDDRDYQGQFKIKDLKGELTAEGVPLQSIESVQGNVDVRMTQYLGNSGTRHADGTRTSYVYVPERYTYKDIAGNFRGRFVRAVLELSGVDGQIDVENEYGQTRLVLEKPLFEVPHRIISHGGDIVVQSNERGYGRLPVLALTECGSVRVGSSDRLFEGVAGSFSTSPPFERRGWRGFVRKISEESDVRFFEQLDRVKQVLAGEDRPAGLDLISRGGNIQLLPAN
jgi:hypothetical protein